MDNNVLWYRESQISRTIKNLGQNNMEGYYISDEEELIVLLKKLISEGSVVGVGDSM